MIRTLRLSDIPRQLLPNRLNSNDLVSTYSRISGKGKMLRPLELGIWTLPIPRNRKAIGSFHNNHLQALLLLQSRQHKSVWEISHAFSNTAGYGELDELIIAAARVAARGGAERIFMRSPLASPADGPATRTGFKHAFKENLLRGTLSSTGVRSLALQKLQPTDLHGRYRLHVAVVPQKIKPAIGMNLEQWLAARENSIGHVQEYIWNIDSEIRAWLRINWLSKSIVIDSFIHPEYSSRTDDFIETAYRIVGYKTKVHWIVRNHEVTIANALNSRGWSVDNSFEVLIKPIAKFAHQTSMLPVQV